MSTGLGSHFSAIGSAEVSREARFCRNYRAQLPS